MRPGDLLGQLDPARYEKVVLALTDHDCVSGIRPLQKAAGRFSNVTVIPGVEISTDHLGNSIHMLGLGIDPDNGPLRERLELLRAGRTERNRRILEKFRALGINIPEETVRPREGQAIGRPLIARWLVDHGYVADSAEAFRKYLRSGGCCYVGRVRYSPAESIRMILSAGGVPVLAHPMQYGFLSREQLEALVADLTAEGLQGIETYYTEFSPEETSFVESLAARYGLIRTGGSDFHGDNKPDYRLGFGWGNLGETFDRIEYQKILDRTE